MHTKNRKPTPVAAAAALAAAIVANAACTDAQTRTEPSPAKFACLLAEMVCHQQPGPNVVDGTDPLWTYCHWWGPGFQPWRYASGAAEFEWTYHANGEIDRIDMRCDDEEPEFAAVAERDATDRVVRWSYTTQMGSTVYSPRDLAYDAEGMLVEARTESPDVGGEIFRAVNTFDYREDGNVRGILIEQSVGESSGSWTWDLEYDGAELARAATTLVEPCEDVRVYEREDGRVTRMVQTAPCYISEGRREFTYDWAGDQLRRSDSLVESPDEVYTEETRYTYENGRIAEVQRDRDGEPLATYWLDYNEEGRLTHLLWWGHQPGPEDMQPE